MIFWFAQLYLQFHHWNLGIFHCGIHNISVFSLTETANHLSTSILLCRIVIEPHALACYIYLTSREEK